MADISMCKNENCEKKETCYRYKAEPNENYQMYNEFKYICVDFNRYKWYWKVKGGK